jgi:hypothetical protein
MMRRRFAASQGTEAGIGGLNPPAPSPILRRMALARPAQDEIMTTLI